MHGSGAVGDAQALARPFVEPHDVVFGDVGRDEALHGQHAIVEPLARPFQRASLLRRAAAIVGTPPTPTTVVLPVVCEEVVVQVRLKHIDHLTHARLHAFIHRGGGGG